MMSSLPSEIPVRKKRGRPKGSKNSKRKTKKQKEKESVTANQEFENAFKDVPIRDDNWDESMTFGMDNAPPGMDDDYSDDDNDESAALRNENEEDVGFGSADIYDVEELIESSKMDVSSQKKESEYETTGDILKDLRVGCVSNSSKKSYESANVMFLTYIFKFNKNVMHKTWIQTINLLSHRIEEEKKDRSIRKTIKIILRKADEACPPIDFSSYGAKDFMVYLLSLETKHNYFDNPTEKQVATMHSNIASQVLKLSKNRRCEAFSWHTHVCNVTKELKRIKSSSN